MTQKVFINELIGWLNSNQKMTIERVLWIDENSTVAFVYDINATKGFPREIHITDILQAIQEEIAIKLVDDPWRRITQDEHLNNKEKEIRDKAWEIISSLVELEPKIYFRYERGRLIQAVIESYNEGRLDGKLVARTVYGYLRRYWQRGKNKNALIPDLSNSTGKGKRKKAGNIKRGRPKKYKHISEVGEGFNVTEEDKKLIRFAIDNYYLNIKEHSLSYAYIRMLKDYYRVDVEYKQNEVTKTLQNLKKISGTYPSFEQFQYWYGEEYTTTEVLMARKGRKKFETQYRPLLGSAYSTVYGVGTQFQIDATIGNIYLRSSYNDSWIIGRPVIYLVVDAFSHMIVGVYVGLEGPSWIGAMMAIANVTSNKVEFCRKYGIEIQEAQWPCYQMPQSIYGDKGELYGEAVESAIDNLGINIDNAAAYRPDWKGLIESRFWIIRNKLEKLLPGQIDPNIKEKIQRRNYRLDATLNLDEFTQAIINLVLAHNSQRMDNYILDRVMIADNVKPIPLNIWNWGVENRNGGLKIFDQELVKLNLLPRAKARITRDGLRFKKDLYYLSLEKDFSKHLRNWENLYVKVGCSQFPKDEKYVEIAYDPRQPNYVYIISDDGRNYEKFGLRDPLNRYTNQHLDEIAYLWATEEKDAQIGQPEELEKAINYLEEIDKIIDRATQRKKTNKDVSLSQYQQTSEIPNNKAFERKQRREDEAFKFDNTKNRTDCSLEKTLQDDKLVQQPNFLKTFYTMEEEWEND